MLTVEPNTGLVVVPRPEIIRERLRAAHGEVKALAKALRISVATYELNTAERHRQEVESKHQEE
jgi:hypothetical protein